ncbi:expressed protein, partial [Phakopsora pachyrhizi]
NASSVSSSSNLYISNTHNPINQQQQLFLSQRDSSRSRNDRSIIKTISHNSSSSSSSSSSSALSLYDSPSRTYSFLASNRKLNSSSRTTPTRSDQRVPISFNQQLIKDGLKIGSNRLIEKIRINLITLILIHLFSLTRFYRFKTLKPKTHLDLPMTPQQIRGSLLRNNATPHQSSLTSTPS